MYHHCERLLLLTNVEKKKQYICSMYLCFTMCHLTQWKANILSQAWETTPSMRLFFHPLVSLPMVIAHQKEQLAQNTLSTWRQPGPVYSWFALIGFHLLLQAEMGLSAILGHRNVLYSASCNSNCRASGIFYIPCIEAQQLQLAWHAVGVFKGGVADKRVSENHLPPRATHTHTPRSTLTEGCWHRFPWVQAHDMHLSCKD